MLNYNWFCAANFNLCVLRGCLPENGEVLQGKEERKMSYSPVNYYKENGTILKTYNLSVVILL